MRSVALNLAPRWQFLVHLSNLLLWVLHRVPGSLRRRLILFLLPTDLFARDGPFTASLHDKLMVQVVRNGVTRGRVVVMIGDFELPTTVSRVISHPEIITFCNFSLLQFK